MQSTEEYLDQLLASVSDEEPKRETDTKAQKAHRKSIEELDESELTEEVLQKQLALLLGLETEEEDDYFNTPEEDFMSQYTEQLSAQSFDTDIQDIVEEASVAAPELKAEESVENHVADVATVSVEPVSEPAPAISNTGVLSDDEIAALFASMEAENSEQEAEEVKEAVQETVKEEPAPAVSNTGVLSDDEIAALFASMEEDNKAEAEEVKEAVQETVKEEPAPAVSNTGVLSDDEIAALFASVEAENSEPKTEEVKEAIQDAIKEEIVAEKEAAPVMSDSGMMSQEEIAALFAAMETEEPAKDESGGLTREELEELGLSDIADVLVDGEAEILAETSGEENSAVSDALKETEDEAPVSQVVEFSDFDFDEEVLLDLENVEEMLEATAKLAEEESVSFDADMQAEEDIMSMLSQFEEESIQENAEAIAESTKAAEEAVSKALEPENIGIDSVAGGAGELLLQIGDLTLAAVEDDPGAHGDIVVDGLRGGLGQVHAAVGTVVIVDGAAEGAAPGGIMETIAAQEGHPVVDVGAVVLAGQVAVGLLGIDAVDAGGGAAVLGNGAGDQGGGQETLAVLVQIQLLGAQVDLDVAAAVGSAALSLVGSSALAGRLLGDALVDVVSQCRGVDPLAIIGNGVADGAAAGGNEAALVVGAAVTAGHGGGIGLNGRLADADAQLVGDLDEAGQGGGGDGLLGGGAALRAVGVGQGDLQVAVGGVQRILHLVGGCGDVGGDGSGLDRHLGGGLQQADGGGGGLGGGVQVIFSAVLALAGHELLLGAAVADGGVDGSGVQGIAQQGLQGGDVVSKDGGGKLGAGIQGLQIGLQGSLIHGDFHVCGGDGEGLAVDLDGELIGGRSLGQGLLGLLQAHAGQVDAADLCAVDGSRGGDGGGLGGDSGGLGRGLGGGVSHGVRGGGGIIAPAGGQP